MNQAEKLDEALTAAGKRVNLVISLVVPDSDIISRITGRRICPTCGTVYHLVHQPSLKPGLCDREGAALIHRTDDTEQVVGQRLAAYHAQTQPLEAYYQRKGLLVEVDGTRSMDAVAEQMSQVVRGRLCSTGSGKL